MNFVGATPRQIPASAFVFPAASTQFGSVSCGKGVSTGRVGCSAHSRHEREESLPRHQLWGLEDVGMVPCRNADAETVIVGDEEHYPVKDCPAGDCHVANSNGGKRSTFGPKSMDFPPEFVRFLRQNGLDPCVYGVAHTLPRYVRVRAHCYGDIGSIQEELGEKLSPVEWMPGFFCIPPETRIAETQAYQQGKIFGMDVASGAAVTALDISPGDHVLDLCAAPGAKLCMISELLGSSGTLTATDISQPRLSACRTMLRKYELDSRCRLFLSDGTTFSLLPLQSPSTSEPFASSVTDTAGGRGSLSSVSHTTSIFGEWTSAKTKKQKRAARRAKLFQVGTGLPELFFYGKDSGIVGRAVSDIFEHSLEEEIEDSLLGYDKVLVDAECTHDGSIKHILKYDDWGWDTFERRFLNPERVSSITRLQFKLLANGFSLLKPGGTLVYSTCSLTQAQNEGVVEQFLISQPLAELQTINISRHWPCRSGTIPNTIRFDPQTSNTSGLFIAKIVRMVV